MQNPEKAFGRNGLEIVCRPNPTAVNWGHHLSPLYKNNAMKKENFNENSIIDRWQ